MKSPVVTVFGATGFLGREICQALVEEGWIVRLAARRPNRVLLSGIPRDRSERVAVDIRRRPEVARALEGTAAAVNAVSLYVQSRKLRFEDVHVRGAAAIAECAREQGVDRLVHISGIGVDPQSPSSYVRARAQGEQAVREAFAGATVLRPSVLFGPGDAFVSNLVKIARLPVVPLFGRGQTRLQPAFVEDVAEAVNVALHRPDSTGRVYELGGGQVLTYREAVAAVMKELGVRRPLMPVPFVFWKLIAALLRPLPNPPLTRDQVVLMTTDNIAGSEIPGFADLELEARRFDQALTMCLKSGFS